MMDDIDVIRTSETLYQGPLAKFAMPYGPLSGELRNRRTRATY